MAEDLPVLISFSSWPAAAAAPLLCFQHLPPLQPRRPRPPAPGVLLASSLGLTNLGRFVVPEAQEGGTLHSSEGRRPGLKKEPRP